ncbi:response regulator, partial [Mucilaginibacter sp.]|uniref:response regulator n=1 Tax=Mucilaginibacter sp. TaxID=1882438 RepID=UPI003563A32C
IWVATFNGGIDQFDDQTGKFIHYKCFNTATGTEDKNLWKLYVDRKNNLWAGSTRGGALYKFNSAQNKFELFDERLINIHALFEDSGGDLWAGDYSNLIRIDRSGKRHQYLSVRNAVRSITEDRWHNLWLGTEGGGLLKYIKATDKLVRYTQANGLPSNSVLNVLMDGKDRLWASTYNGLAEYNVRSNTFKNYDVSDGLQSNQFNFNAALKLRSGELVFGGINGFNVFHPDSINQYQSKPNLKIVGLQVNNKQLLGASKLTDYKGIIDMAKLLVPYNDATIAISYTVPEYSFAEKINYAYYLEGWDHGWNNVGKLKTAYYTRLNEGTYKLRIRAQNRTNPALSSEISLQIIVMPPWYRTWWAYLLYFLFISLVIYLIRMYRIRQAGLKYEVTLANLNVEREKELNEKKLSFFTNISHEFRTPLTLIINPIKDLLKTNSADTRDELNTIYRNARRLLGLVDQLLLFRKTESENDTLHIVKCDFAKICRDTFNCFSYQAKVKSINYNYYDDDQQLTVAADKEKLEIAIFNLIANAIKFTPVGGTINIVVGAVNGKLSVKIEDSGCGVKEEIGDRLFDKFYQVKDNTSLKTGFGIGLYLTKNFIEKHGGSISYFPNNLQGTTFVVEIPHNPVMNDDDDQPSILSDNQLINEMVEEIESSEMAEEHYEQLPLLISERQTILVIDDNENLRSYIKKIFKDEFRMIEASNGEEGLSITRKHIPDLIICDVKMGGISGIEFCDIIKKDTSLNHIPVILLTGEADSDIRLKSIEVGAVDFVNKPFEKDILMARVRGILRDRKELQNYFYNEVTLKLNTRNISEDYKEFLYKCVSVIENKIIEPDFDVKTIADELGMSYSSLFKKLKAITGQSVNNFVRFVRLRKAAEMMINTNCNVNEAALNAGFNDIKYFREQFIKLFGVKPSDFIKQHRNAFNKNFTIEQSFK